MIDNCQTSLTHQKKQKPGFSLFLTRLHAMGATPLLKLASRRLHLGWLALLISGSISGCALFGPRITYTPPPPGYIPTAIALTVHASYPLTNTPSPIPSQTPIPTMMPSPSATSLPESSPTSLPPSETPTPETSLVGLFATTPLPPDQIPYAKLQILQPGPLSKVTSPIAIRLYVQPGHNGRVRLELLGEDGRSLARKLLTASETSSRQVYLNTELAFEISAMAETARLQVSIDDAQGRLAFLNSVDVVLLSVGETELNPRNDLREPILIQMPTEHALIQSNKVLVAGQARKINDEPIKIKLITTEGYTMVERLAILLPAENGDYGTFAVEVPYQVNAPTWVRLIVQVRGTRPPGAVYLSSLEVLLSP
jgi:hypothetical protein